MTAVALVRVGFGFGFGALFAFGPNFAHADGQDLLSLNAVISRTYFENLFKRPSDGSAGIVSSDYLTTTQVNITARKLISLQKFELTAALVDNSYRNFATLDSQNNNYNAAWNWQFTPRLTGILSSSRQQSQTDFADFRGAGQNLRTSDSQKANAEWNFMGGWFLGAGLTDTTQTNSQPFVEDAGNKQQATDILVRYAFPSGTSMSMTHSVSKGDYSREPDAVTLSDSRFSDTRDDFNLTWPVTGKVQLTAGIGRIARKNEHFSIRDYAARNGNVKVVWAATGKTSVTLTRARSTDSWQDNSSSFSVRDSTSLSGNLQLAAKLSLGASVARETRTYGGFALVPAAFDRIDKTGSESLSLNWSLLRSLTLMASFQQSRRNSTRAGNNFSDRTATVSATATF